MPTHRRRRAAALLVAALLAFLLTAAATSDRVGAITSESVTQWNIQAGCGGGGACGAPEATQALQFLIAAANPKPLTVTVNEMCALNFVALDSYLTSIGYVGEFNTSVPNANCGVGNVPYGNAVFQLGVLTSGGDTGSSYFPDAAQDPGQYIPGSTHTNNRRGFRCLETNLFGYIRTGCATHFVNRNLAWQGWPWYDAHHFTQEQSSYMLYLASVADGNVRVGGDFNLHNPLNWFVDFRSVGHPSAETFPAVSPDEHLDWFMGNPYSPSSDNGLPWCDDPNDSYVFPSDHCLVAGTFYTL